MTMITSDQQCTSPLSQVSSPNQLFSIFMSNSLSNQRLYMCNYLFKALDKWKLAEIFNVLRKNVTKLWPSSGQPSKVWNGQNVVVNNFELHYEVLISQRSREEIISIFENSLSREGKTLRDSSQRGDVKCQEEDSEPWLEKGRASSKQYLSSGLQLQTQKPSCWGSVQGNSFSKLEMCCGEREEWAGTK